MGCSGSPIYWSGPRCSVIKREIVCNQQPEAAQLYAEMQDSKKFRNLTLDINYERMHFVVSFEDDVACKMSWHETIVGKYIDKYIYQEYPYAKWQISGAAPMPSQWVEAYKMGFKAAAIEKTDEIKSLKDTVLSSETRTLEYAMQNKNLKQEVNQLRHQTTVYQEELIKKELRMPVQVIVRDITEDPYKAALRSGEWKPWGDDNRYSHSVEYHMYDAARRCGKSSTLADVLNRTAEAGLRKRIEELNFSLRLIREIDKYKSDSRVTSIVIDAKGDNIIVNLR